MKTGHLCWPLRRLHFAAAHEHFVTGATVRPTVPHVPRRPQRAEQPPRLPWQQDEGHCGRMMTFVLQGREEVVQVEQTSPINEQHWPTYSFPLIRMEGCTFKRKLWHISFPEWSCNHVSTLLGGWAGRGLVEESGLKKRGTIWPTSLKSHCQHICHTLQLRSDCVTVLFI